MEETDEEDNVYPLSIKYDKKKAWKIMLMRFFYLFIFIILLIPTDLYTFGVQRTLEVRTGYFADRVWEKDIPISGVTEFKIQTKNCIVYLLENKGSTTNMELYISAPTSTSVNTDLSGGVQNIKVDAEKGWLQCYVELKIPGGQTLNKLSLTFNGDSIVDLLVYDSKDGSTWTTPMDITTLEIVVSDSYPNIIFENAHTVGTLTVSGTYCVCNFHTLKITTMTYAITVGSLSIKQNSAIPTNKVIVTTPDGTH